MLEKYESEADVRADWPNIETKYNGVWWKITLDPHDGRYLVFYDQSESACWNRIISFLNSRNRRLEWANEKR